jgi:predicted flap endonuclease-1-like 5' DNA nuclease
VVAILLAIAGIVGGALAKSHRTASIILLLVPGVLGFICLSAFWTLPGILLIIGGILEIASGSKREPVMMAAPAVAPAPVTERAPALRSPAVAAPAAPVPTTAVPTAAAPAAAAPVTAVAVTEQMPAVAEAAVAAPAVADAAVPVTEAAPAVTTAPVAQQAPPVAAAAAPLTEQAPTVADPLTAAAPVVEEVPTATPDARRISGLIDIEGIGPVYAEKLGAVGLKTTDDLLKVGATPKGREDLVFATGISHKLILRWVNMADLFRIKGVGEQYSDLLEAAGVDTVPELAQRRADNLTKKMAEVNEEKHLVRRLPVESQVADWIESAKNLPRVVTY